MIDGSQKRPNRTAAFAVEAGDEARAEALARRHAEHGERLILDGMAVSAQTGT